MTTVEIDRMTVGEFVSFVDRAPKQFDYELRDGEIVEMTFPKSGHTRTQSRLRELARQLLDRATWFVEIEVPYQTGSFDLRRADIAAIKQSRWEKVDGDEILQSPPDWVAEVLSPSNTRVQILNTRDHCLANGCQDFWVIDPKGKRVTVYNANSDGVLYRSGDSVPLLIEAGRSIAVAEIFD